ncbi:alkene reductase [Edaphobacter flagellatus]|uniref:alkene reductase n=1 Tax=Edaphobacter flagellatus TaxID=1933044 RepID=UPI0021B1620D|nr:alkene reductase [Edaphobacter flagellatus]
MPSLFDPIQVGAFTLPNRIFMAPLTRLRGTPDHVPTPIMAEYYTQRASAGLIISEGIPIDPLGVGYPNVPGLWSQQQVEAWKPITKAVHNAGGRIFAQIWHVGRISHPALLNGQTPVAPSPIAAPGNVNVLRPARPFVTPRPLELSEIKAVVEAFRHGAENAQAAGFDGVELHGANGYLLDQFLQDGTNQRTDEYGGSIENRARLLLEATDAAISVWGADRVGMHLAPRGGAHGISDSNPSAVFGYVATELGKRKLAFIVARERVAADSIGPDLKQLFGGVFVANEALTQQTGQQLLNEGKADAVAYGKLFIANPDLVARFRRASELNQPVPETFYTHTPQGYIDYPTLSL